VLAATVIGFGDLLQVAPDSPFRWLIPPAYGAIALLGFGWGVITRFARPAVYAGIGRGTDGRLSAGPVVPPLAPLSAEPLAARVPLRT
jgi:hypothetical protein